MNKPCNGCEHAMEHTGLKRKHHYPWNKEFCDKCEKYKDYQTYLEKRRIYIKGKPIKSIAQFDEHIIKDGIVYWENKPYHAGWFCSMPYKVIVNAIKSGYVFVAVRKGEIINGE